MMEMTRAILIAVTLSCFVVNGQGAHAADYRDGNDLFEACEGVDDSYCLGYILGVADAYRVKEVFCGPNIKGTQVMDIVKPWLRDHPEARHRPAVDLIETALKEKFPCN